MAVCRLNVTIQTVNNKFSALITTDLSTGIYSLFLSGIVSAGALCSATFYIPATFGIVNNMMRSVYDTLNLPKKSVRIP